MNRAKGTKQSESYQIRTPAFTTATPDSPPMRKKIIEQCLDIKKSVFLLLTVSTTLQDVSPANQGGTFVYNHLKNKLLSNYDIR